MFYRNKKVLVTGGTGFVGTHFVEALLAQDAKVVVPIHQRKMVVKDSRIQEIPADLSKLDDALRAMEGIDYIFHCAGAVAAAQSTVTNPMSAIVTNLIVTSRVLEAAWTQKIERVLIFSSGTTAYPLLKKPLNEDDMWGSPPPPVYSGYGWMRRYLELLGTYVGEKSGVKVAILRPTAVYGRHDDFSPKSSHVVPALIHRALKKENPFVVWGTGEETRDILHVKDLARGGLLLLEKRATGEPVNIGYGRSTTIAEVVRIVLKAAGHQDAKIEFDPTKPTTVPYREFDTSRAKKWLGFEPQITLQDGLADTVKWFKELTK